MKKLLKGGLLSLLAIGALTGCGGSGGSSSGVTITIWEDESNIEMLQTLANEFISSYKRSYPLAGEVRIRFIEQSEKSAVEKLSQVASTGNGPDILAITHDTISAGVKAGNIDEVSHTVDLVDRMSEGAMNAVTYNDKVYGYPITAESMTLMYDKDQLSETDVASFAALKASNKKIAMDLQVDGGYYGFGLNSDSVLFGEDGKTATEVEIGTTQAVNNWTSFINNYANDTIASMTPETSISLLDAGQIAGVISSPFLYSNVVDTLGADKVGLAVLPSIDGNAQRPFSGYKCYAVNRYSKNPALAHMVAEFLTSDDAQAWRLSQKSYLPVAKNYTEDMNDIINASEHLTVMKESLDQSITMPNIDQMGNFWKPMNNAVNAMWNLKGTTVTTTDIKTILDEVTTTVLR